MRSVDAEPQRLIEDRVEEQEGRDALPQRDQVGGDADRLGADFGDDDVGTDVVEDVLERLEMTDRSDQRHLVVELCVGGIGAVDVAKRRDRVLARQPRCLEPRVEASS